jgi:hypothetical protein
LERENKTKELSTATPVKISRITKVEYSLLGSIEKSSAAITPTRLREGNQKKNGKNKIFYKYKII